MKRILSFALTALMIMSFITPVFAVSPAPADPDPDVNSLNIYVQDVQYDPSAPGAKTFVNVYVCVNSNTEGFEYMKYTLFYPKCLTLDPNKTDYIGENIDGILIDDDARIGIETSATLVGKENTIVEALEEQGKSVSDYASADRKFVTTFIDAKRTSRIRKYDDEEGEYYWETYPIDLIGDGKLVRYRFTYDASLNPNGEDVEIELLGMKRANFLHCKSDYSDYSGQEYTANCYSGKIDLPDPAPKTPKFVVSDETIDQDDETATFDVDIADNPGLYSTQLFIIYDENMSFNSFAVGEGFKSAYYKLNPNETPGVIDQAIDEDAFEKFPALEDQLNAAEIDYEGKIMTIVHFESAEDGGESEGDNPVPGSVSTNGTLFSLTLNTPDLSGGTYPIYLVYTPGNTIDLNKDEIVFEVGNGSLTVDGCDHDYQLDEAASTGATCTVPGNKHYVCSKCGKTKDETIPAPGHVEEDIPAIPATCTEGGWTAGKKCSVCQAVLVEPQAINPLQHDFSVFVKTVEPKCEEGGYDVYKCSREGCNETTHLNETQKLGHDWVQGEVTGNCEETGTVHYTCSRCSATKTENGAVIQHVWVKQDTSVDPTCTAGGHLDERCERCGKTQSTNLNPLGHNYVFTETVAPTCQEQGYDLYTCDRCHVATDKRNFVNANGHELELDEAASTPATCTVGGNDHYKCKNCNYTEDRPTDPRGHDFTEQNTSATYLKSKATCTEAAVYYYKCSRCDANEQNDNHVFSYGSSLGHDFSEKIPDEAHLKSAATCKAKAVYYYDCSLCDVMSTTDTYEYGELAEHQYKSVVTPPTCEAGGYTTLTCSVCGDTKIVGQVGPNGHSFGDQPKIHVDPTCTEGGYDLFECSVCHKTEKRNEVGPNGHSFGDQPKIHVDPTCTEGGYDLFECSVCHTTEKRNEVGPNGHSFGDQPVEHVEPTCTEGGYDLFECSVCHVTEKRNITDPLGHTLGDEPIETVAPTCDEEGYDLYECSVCHEKVKKNVKDALGHDFSIKVETVAPTATERGYTVYKCANCGETIKKDFTDPITAPAPTIDDNSGENNNNNNNQNGSKQTGDNIATILFIAVITLVSGAAVVVAKKKVFNR